MTVIYWGDPMFTVIYWVDPMFYSDLLSWSHILQQFTELIPVILRFKAGYFVPVIVVVVEGSHLS